MSSAAALAVRRSLVVRVFLLDIGPMMMLDNEWRTACQPWAVGGRLDLGTVGLQRVEPDAVAVGVLNNDQPSAYRVEDWRMQDAQLGERYVPSRQRRPVVDGDGERVEHRL